MKQEKLLDAVTSLEPDILETHETYRRACPTARRKRRIATWGATAACALLVAFGALWFFAAPAVDTTEDTLTIHFAPVGDYLAEYYMVTDLTHAEEAFLPLRLGELYVSDVTHEFFRVKGEDDLVYLIRRNHDAEGTLSLFEFACFTDMMPGSEVYPLPTLAEGWALIYGAEGAEDIETVTFEKGHARYGVEESVTVPTVTLTDPAAIARFYEAFGPLGECETALRQISPNSREYLDGEQPLTVQTMRRVTVTFVGGRTESYELFATDNALRVSNRRYGSLAEDDLDWVIETAGIDLAWRDWGTDKEAPPQDAADNAGNEITSPRPAPGNTVETEKLPDVDPAA